MFQVLVKTTEHMQGSYAFTVDDRAAADRFVQRPDVWWYHYPAEHEDWDWRRGGAWAAAPGEREETGLATDLQNSGNRLSPVHEEENDDDDDDDGRW